MKSLKILMVAVGLCLGTQGYADTFTANATLEGQRYFDFYHKVVPSGSYCCYEWGVDQSVDSGQTLTSHYSVKTSGAKLIRLANTYIHDLKPKGSNTAHNTEGAVEQAWSLSDGTVLFTTEINSYSYLYKMRPVGSTTIPDANVNVGNNSPLFNNKQAVMNMGARGTTKRTNIRALHKRSLLEAKINGQSVLFYGEYNVGNSDPVALWKSTNMGDTWTKVIEWNTSGHQTRHIHGVVQNPYNKWIYILLGDDNEPGYEQSGIVAWDGTSPVPPDNTSLDRMNTYMGWKTLLGSQAVTGDVVFTPPPPSGSGKVVWIQDIDEVVSGQIIKGQRANYDLSNTQSTGTVPFSNGHPPILGVRSDTGSIFWASFITTPATDQKIHLWRSKDDGLSWARVYEVPVYNDWVALPQDLQITGSTIGTDGGITDFLTLSGRDLEFVSGGSYTGSRATFTSTISATGNNTNLVLNPSFELCCNIPNWSPGTYGNLSRIEQHSGTYSLSMYNPSAYSNLLYQSIPNVSAGIYTAKVWMKKNSATVTYAEFGLKTSGGQVVKSSAVNTLLTSNWVQVTIPNITVSAAGTYQLYYSATANANGAVYLDDFELIKN
jgi:hypothetical protein